MHWQNIDYLKANLTGHTYESIYAPNCKSITRKTSSSRNALEKFLHRFWTNAHKWCCKSNAMNEQRVYIVLIDGRIVLSSSSWSVSSIAFHISMHARILSFHLIESCRIPYWFCVLCSNSYPSGSQVTQSLRPRQFHQRRDLMCTQLLDVHTAAVRRITISIVFFSHVAQL
jgi:hypothetical protein